MIDRLDWATRRPVWFSIKQHQTFCFHSIASPTNTINQFAVEFVAIAERGGGGGYIAFSVTSSNVLFCIILFKGDFVRISFRWSHDPRVEGASHGSSLLYPACTFIACTIRLKGAEYFFRGSGPTVWTAVGIRYESIDPKFYGCKGFKVGTKHRGLIFQSGTRKKWKYELCLAAICNGDCLKTFPDWFYHEFLLCKIRNPIDN